MDSRATLWLALDPNIRCYVSWLWAGFVPHFGSGPETIISVPDEGGPLEVGRSTLRMVPAHYLHSSGNFHLYDPATQILFSGDVGAALLPASASDLYVQDFAGWDPRKPRRAGVSVCRSRAEVNGQFAGLVLEQDSSPS